MLIMTLVATVLNAACLQQPTVGNLISIKGNVFSSQIVNITTPQSTQNSTFTGVDTGGLNLGAKVGISVSAILFALGLTGFCIVWNGKRRRRRTLAKRQRESGYQDWRTQHQFREDGH